MINFHSHNFLVPAFTLKKIFKKGERQEDFIVMGARNLNVKSLLLKSSGF